MFEIVAAHGIPYAATANYEPKEFSDAAEYLKKQSRFQHLTDEDIQVILNSRDAKWESIHKNYKIK